MSTTANQYVLATTVLNKTINYRSFILNQKFIILVNKNRVGKTVFVEVGLPVHGALVRVGVWRKARKPVVPTLECNYFPRRFFRADNFVKSILWRFFRFSQSISGKVFHQIRGQGKQLTIVVREEVNVVIRFLCIIWIGGGEPQVTITIFKIYGDNQFLVACFIFSEGNPFEFNRWTVAKFRWIKASTKHNGRNYKQ